MIGLNYLLSLFIKIEGIFMAKVKVDNVVKIYSKNVVALRGITFEVKDKEFFVLLGPSGCGKTTTLRIIAGLEKPTSGRVFIDDFDVTDLPPKDRDVAMVFQTWALYPHMSVYKNIAFPLKIRGMSREEIDKRVREIARLLQIEELLDRMPKQLSGGQQQRVALARALVRKPKVWLLDEPLSNLDALLRVHMRAELKKLQRDVGVTAIYVTHDQVEAMTIADRIAVMRSGEIMQLGSPLEIYHKPRNVFVASFIGTPPMNLMRGSLVENESIYIDGGDWKYKVPERYKSLLKDYIGKDVILGFRPENARISGNPIEGSIEGEVYVIEPLGSEVIIDLRVGDTIVKVKAPISEELLKLKGKVYILPQEEKIHIFDARTELNIL